MVTQRLARAVGSAVGLAQESYAHNKAKKAAAAERKDDDQLKVDQSRANVHDSNAPSDSENDIEYDSDAWAQDGAQGHLVEQRGSMNTTDKAAEFNIDQFIRRHTPPKVTDSHGLIAPVMIPQRRPGSSLRGFVRAYAPPLAACDVERDAWLEFMTGFHQSIKGQRNFNIANLAFALSVLTYTVSFGPSVVVHFSALAVHSSIEAARRMYINNERLAYLDEMNERYFKPRGLFVLMMKFDSSRNGNEVVDFDTEAFTAVSKREDPTRTKAKDLVNPTSGSTLASQMPEVCPLEFPELDAATPEQRKNGFRRAMAFTSDYFDRRSQALFDEHNPDSKLSVQQKPFAGKYADPTTFENSGIIGVLTGGYIDRGQRKWERRNQQRLASGRKPLQPGERGGLIGGAIQTVRKAVQENVIYLLVVKMPTEGELAKAAALQAKLKQENPKWYEKLRLRVNMSK
ncbi:hypothetical protein K461DRAFT_294985 [Myriangium duriaei CBS 260.36]|uniref:Uncharacterized protein n=1 Tax=Myriangium duriaei CBS 260.36 TaxID=1168546 RepID=A0A9P4J4A5_9PEZI|nr:hypothetical protein K461DRAFT_294985 [Myriangium duriaei CBS 260.36]